MAGAIRDFVASQSVPWAKVIGISIGMPGVVKQGVAVLPSMPGWAGTPVQQVVSELLGQAIYLDNNAKLGALAETCFGNGRDVESMLYVRVGTGIGSGLVLGGQIYRGSAGSAGEIGHMVVDPRGLPCPCGNVGCLETVASKQAIVDRVSRARPEARDIIAVLRLAQEGDPACVESLEDAGRSIGAIVVGLVNFLSPTLIVIDGSTMRAGELLLRPIREAVATRSLPTPRMQTRVVAGALGSNAIALGAVATVQHAIFSDGATLHAIAAALRPLPTRAPS
jgi:predicted NBD/HSP70 family sugar kinase